MRLLCKIFENLMIDEESHGDNEGHCIKNVLVFFLPVCH